MNLSPPIFYPILYAKDEICQDTKHYRRTNYHNNCESENTQNLGQYYFLNLGDLDFELREYGISRVC